MQVVDGLLAVLAVDVGRDVVHRAGAIERHHGDDVLEAVGLQPLQAVAHARAFELEHADRVGRAPASRRSCLSSSGSLARSMSMPRPRLMSSTAFCDHGQRLEAEEVELHQAGRLDPLPVELGDREARLADRGRAAPARRAAGRRSPCRRRGWRRGGRGLRASARSRAGARRSGSLSRSSCSLGSISIACGSVTGLAGLLGTSLHEPVDLAVGHLQHAADVAQHRARLQLAVA